MFGGNNIALADVVDFPLVGFGRERRNIVAGLPSMKPRKRSNDFLLTRGYDFRFGSEKHASKAS